MVIGFVYGGMYVDIGGDVGEYDVVDVVCVQDYFQVGGVEGVFVWFVDDDFIGDGGQFGNDFLVWFVVYQDVVIGVGIVDVYVVGVDLV